MHLNDLLVPARVLANANAESKKRALEVLSELLSKDQPALTQADAMQSLVTRERLGSTAIGRGVAVPHGRAASLTQPVAALIRLNSPVDYGAEDQMPVGVMFGLLVPQACSREHSEMLARATLRLSDPELIRRLREAKTSKALYECFGEEGDVHALRMGLRA